jgi:dephospho-CoA kinase
MIVGITGTFGAGKGAVVSYLVSKKDFVHYSARKFFAEEMEKQGIPITRDTMIEFANKLRIEKGPRCLFDTLYEKALVHGASAVIESIRTVAEAEALKERGGILLAVDADQKTRYARIHGRGSALDQVTFEEFKRQEALEMHSEDPHKQNISAVMQMADATILNNGSLAALHREIENVFATC